MPTKTPSTHKFAVLLTEESPQLASPIQLRDGLELRLASLTDLAGDQVKEWKDMIGRFAWDERNRKRLVCVNTARTQRPDVLDREHEALGLTCNNVWFAYQLARPAHPNYGKCVVAKGHATETTPGDIVLGVMQGCHDLHALVRPNYGDDPLYTELWRRQFDWLIDPGWPQRVADCWWLIDAALDSAGDFPPLTDRALDAYSVALRMNGVDHRLPYFVRSAESVLAAPRNRTRAEFIRRALLFLPNITSHLYAQAANIGTADVETYVGDQLRSDCVHGKDPASELAAQGKPIDLVAKYEFLAEALANATTQWAMREHAFLRTMTHAQLEAAWANNQVPLP